MTYLKLPQNVGDDETTIVFTQNMNRIYIAPEAIQNEKDGEINEVDNESSDNESKDMQVPLKPLTPHDETTQAYRHGR